jgi:hypothetical protein
VSRPLCGAYLGHIPRPFSSSSPARQFLYFSAIKEREDPSVLCCTGIYVGIFISHMYTAARPESSAVKKTTPGFMGHHHHKYLSASSSSSSSFSTCVFRMLLATASGR